VPHSHSCECRSYSCLSVSTGSRRAALLHHRNQRRRIAGSDAIKQVTKRSGRNNPTHQPHSNAGRKTLDAVVALTGRSYESPVKGPTYVFSRTQPPGERDGVIFTNQSPRAWLSKIRTRPGKHICHMGDGELARSFLEADLIDELFLGVVPTLLGAGLPLFPAASRSATSFWWKIGLTRKAQYH
jgi:hypothetical protein